MVHALEAAKDLPGLFDPGSAPTPTALMQTQTFNDFTCNSGTLIVGQDPVGRTGKPSLVMTFPASVQYGEIFTIDTQATEANPSSYSHSTVGTTVQSIYDFGLRYPLPLNAAFLSVNQSGGNWNSAWGAAPALGTPPQYYQFAAQGTPAGVPGGTPVVFPHIQIQAQAITNAGSTINLTLPSTGSFETPTYYYAQRVHISGPVTTDAMLYGRCNPTQSGNVLIASIPVVPIQTTTTLVAPNAVEAGSSFTLTAQVTSSIAGIGAGEVSFGRVGAGTIGTVNISGGSATLNVTAPQEARGYMYTAHFTPPSGNYTDSDGSASVDVVAAAANSLAVFSGDAQTVPVGQSFAPLLVRALDVFGNPVGNLAVNFAAPTTGASAVLNPSSTTTANDGVAEIGAVANAIGGSYVVTASAGSLSTAFHLTNQAALSIVATPAFPSVRVGESTAVSVAVAGAGLSLPVHLNATLPTGVTGVWSDNDVTPPATPTLTLTAAGNAPLGVGTVSVSAASGSFSTNQLVPLYVHDVTPGLGAISIDLLGQGIQMQPDEVAGVARRPQWNPAMGSEGVMLGLLDETGASTSVELDWAALWSWHLPDVVDAPGDTRMMTGYLDPRGSGESTQVAIRNLPANPDGYDVYIYADGDNTINRRTGMYTIDDGVVAPQTVSIMDPEDADFEGTFVNANNGEGNFAVVHVAGTSFTLTATPGLADDGTERAPLNGIQIVPSVAVAPDDVIFADGFEQH